MLYQKLLMGRKPYAVNAGNANPFEVHRHPEMELSFCLGGNYDLICENKRYTLTEGDLAMIPPMAAHEIPKNNDTSCKSLMIELGYAFLGDHFEPFIKHNLHCLIFRREELVHSAPYRELAGLANEIARLYRSYSTVSDLTVKGDLYKISALLLQLLSTPRGTELPNRKISDLEKVDKALDIIYNRYYESLDIESVSALCGYSKSNFCKVFKTITGDTFHNTLNRHRVEIACMLLRERNDPIEKIAAETGFADLKSFCRVFQRTMGQNAGKYRKNFREKEEQ